MNLSAINTLLLGLIIALHAFIGKQVWDMKMALTESAVEQRHLSSSMSDLRARIAAVELRTAAAETDLTQLKWRLAKESSHAN